MTFYAVYRVADGKLISVGSVVNQDALPVEYDFTAIGSTPPDLGIVRWDAATHSFVPRTITADELEVDLQPYYERWQFWKNTLAGGIAKGVPQAAIDKFAAREGVAWDAYWGRLSAWYQAYSS